MRNYVFILAAALSAQEIFAMDDALTLDRLLGTMKGTAPQKVDNVLQEYQSQYPEDFAKLREEVIKDDFSNRAGEAGVSQMKSSRISNFFRGESYGEIKSPTRPTVQKEKAVESLPEITVQLKHTETRKNREATILEAPKVQLKTIETRKAQETVIEVPMVQLKPIEATEKTQETGFGIPKVQLKHVDLSIKEKNIEAEQDILTIALKHVSENTKQLREETRFAFDVKLKSVQKKLEEAQEYYDNLSLAISFLRGDLAGMTFKNFVPVDHQNDNPGQYIEALVAALDYNPHALDTQSKAQVTMASDLLRQANENLALGRAELETINREMLELTQ